MTIDEEIEDRIGDLYVSFHKLRQLNDLENLLISMQALRLMLDEDIKQLEQQLD